MAGGLERYSERRISWGYVVELAKAPGTSPVQTANTARRLEIRGRNFCQCNYWRHSKSVRQNYPQQDAHTENVWLLLAGGYGCLHSLAHYNFIQHPQLCSPFANKLNE